MTDMSRTIGSVTSWLADLGLEVYAERFEQADIDLEVLEHLSDQDLTDLGVTSLGHRRKILARIADLRDAPAAVVPPAPVEDQSERLYLTVVFCDLVGSTQLAHSLGEERFTDLLGEFYRAVDGAVDRYGGHVAQYHGDGVLIYFGYPQALEDAALRGVMAACESCRRVGAIAVPGARPMQVRVGVASGPVVIGDRHLSQHARGGRAYGAVVNLAARLQAEAQPGGVVVSDTTAALIKHHFELNFLGLRQLKGIDEPAPVYAVEARRTPDLGMALLARPDRVPFVNRRAELARLAACWNAVAMGAFNLITVAGEHGIGKSRLVGEFLDRLRREDRPVRHVNCPQQGRDTPYGAFRLLLDHDPDLPAAATLRAELEAVPRATQAERRQRRARVIGLLADHFGRTASGAKALWIDDLQWADPSTIDVLLTLASRRPPGLMLIVSARNALPDPRLMHVDGSVPISLGLMSPEHTNSIVREVLGDVKGAEALVAPLVARAEGIPVFAEELALEMRARLAGPEDVAADSLPDMSVPSSLQQSLQARIRRLVRARPLLRLVASIGREAPLPLLRDLWPGPGSIEEALDELIAAGLAELHLARDSQQDNRLILRHQLLQDCAYDIILTRDRERIHTAIAEALDRRRAAGQAVEPTLLADQLERAGRLRPAAELWAEAGRAAAAQSADAEAVALFRRALALLPRIGTSEGDWSDQFEADTLLALFPALIGAKGYRAAGEDVLGRINALIERTGGSQRVFSTMFFRWIDICVQGDIDAGHEFAVGLADIARSDPTGLHALVLDRMLGSSHMFRGEFDDARQYLDRFLATYDPDLHAEPLRPFGATDNHATVLCCIAAIEAFTGTPENTRAATAAALASARASEMTHTLCHTLTFGAAFPAAIRRDWGAFRDHASELKQLAQSRQLAFWLVYARMLTGIGDIAAGRVDEGQAEFDYGSRVLGEQGFEFLQPTFRVIHAMAEETARRDGPSGDLAALERAVRSGERWMLPECLRLKERWGRS